MPLNSRNDYQAKLYNFSQGSEPSVKESKKTLEAKLPLASSQPNNIQGIFSELFANERKSLENIIERTMVLIADRELIRNKNIQMIYDEILMLENIMLRIPKFYYNIHQDVMISHHHIRNQILNLTREKRMQLVECWRDTVNLKLNLQRAINELNNENDFTLNV